jgi:hypothetical protein
MRLGRGYCIEVLGLRGMKKKKVAENFLKKGFIMCIPAQVLLE